MTQPRAAAAPARHGRSHRHEGRQARRPRHRSRRRAPTRGSSRSRSGSRTARASWPRRSPTCRWRSRSSPEDVFKIPLGWLQLKKEKLRFAVALLGVAFAVVLILMQLGFREAMFGSAVRYHEHLRYDIALVSPEMAFIVQPRSLLQPPPVPGPRRAGSGLGEPDLPRPRPVEEPDQPRDAEHLRGGRRARRTTPSPSRRWSAQLDAHHGAGRGAVRRRLAPGVRPDRRARALRRAGLASS